MTASTAECGRDVGWGTVDLSSIKGVEILGPKLFFVTGLVIFATAVARLVCPDLLG